MYLTRGLARLVAFLRTGYPTGWPVMGYVPLAALLRRRLSDDEIPLITNELLPQPGPISDADVGVEITMVTNEMPSPEDIERVQRRIDAIGQAPTSGP